MSENLTVSRWRIASAMFLVGGTCIGGGMLALPIATGISGFFPSLVMMSVCWLAMTATALLLLEVSLWMREGAHIITMTSEILGPVGKAVAWLVYLFICYASIVAYTAGGGVQVGYTFQEYVPAGWGKEIGSSVFIVLFGIVISLGSKTVGRVNSILFIAMVAAYVMLVGMGIDEVKPSLLFTKEWSTALIAVPLLLTSFSFQTMVPSLTPYLQRNAKALRWAIIGGTSIAFLVYAVWQWLILGIVPVGGSNGLAAALASGEPATLFLQEHVSSKLVARIAEFFAFFSIVTSFLGIALGLFDFLSDGLKIKKEGWGKVALSALIIIPTLIFATQFERVFLIALGKTGGFGDSILNGIIPVLMVWVGRYRLSKIGDYKMGGGKLLLILIGVFFACTLLLEILGHFGHVTSIYDSVDDIIEIHNVKEAMED
jgi:tyrosine-specific transport protein